MASKAKESNAPVPGYEKLQAVLLDAYNQSARGKGADRHEVGNKPFEDQPILVGARHFGTGALLFQAFKKTEESQRLDYPRARAELLGAIIYISAAVVHLDEQNGD